MRRCVLREVFPLAKVGTWNGLSWLYVLLVLCSLCSLTMYRGEACSLFEQDRKTGAKKFLLSSKGDGWSR